MLWSNVGSFSNFIYHLLCDYGNCWKSNNFGTICCHSFHAQSISENCLTWTIRDTNFFGNFPNSVTTIAIDFFLNFFHLFISFCWCAWSSNSIIIFNRFTTSLKAFVLFVNSSFTCILDSPKAFCNISTMSEHFILFFTQNLMQILWFSIVKCYAYTDYVDVKKHTIDIIIVLVLLYTVRLYIITVRHYTLLVLFDVLLLLFKPTVIKLVYILKFRSRFISTYCWPSHHLFLSVMYCNYTAGLCSESIGSHVIQSLWDLSINWIPPV